MIWIKASDRQPEDWTGIVIKNGLGPKFIVSTFMVSMNGIKIPPQYDSMWRWDDFEWLDETPQAIIMGTESGPISRPFFQIDNQTFFLDQPEAGTELWFADQMQAAFEKLGVKVIRSCSCGDDREIESRGGELICKTCEKVIK